MCLRCGSPAAIIKHRPATKRPNAINLGSKANLIVGPPALSLRPAPAGGNEVGVRCSWGVIHGPFRLLPSRTHCCWSIDVILGVMATLATLLVVSISVNALLIVAASSDRFWSWAAGYLLSASVSAALLTGGAVLLLP
jgi:hypothetical protein